MSRPHAHPAGQHKLRLAADRARRRARRRVHGRHARPHRHAQGVVRRRSSRSASPTSSSVPTGVAPVDDGDGPVARPRDAAAARRRPVAPAPGVAAATASSATTAPRHRRGRQTARAGPRSRRRPGRRTPTAIDRSSPGVRPSGPTRSPSTRRRRQGAAVTVGEQVTRRRRPRVVTSTVVGLVGTAASPAPTAAPWRCSTCVRRSELLGGTAASSTIDVRRTGRAQDAAARRTSRPLLPARCQGDDRRGRGRATRATGAVPFSSSTCSCCLRAHRAVRRLVPDLQHLLDPRRPAHPRAGAAARARCEPRAGRALASCSRPSSSGSSSAVLGLGGGSSLALVLRALFGAFGADAPAGRARHRAPHLVVAPPSAGRDRGRRLPARPPGRASRRSRRCATRSAAERSLRCRTHRHRRCRAAVLAARWAASRRPTTSALRLLRRGGLLSMRCSAVGPDPGGGRGALMVLRRRRSRAPR